MLEPHMDRVTWDAPLHSLADMTALEPEPKAINSKPSRFGSLRECSRLRALRERGIAVYGGGQGELGPGRGQIQYLASLFHNDTPNDVAPSGYNDPAVPDGHAHCPDGARAFGDGLPLGRIGWADGRAGFAEALNEQVANEFAASQQYIAIAVHYDVETLPQLARFFYRQAVEERNHAMMIVQYLLDADAEVAIPGVESPQPTSPTRSSRCALALEQEKRVTEQIGELAQAAREEGDYQGEQFMQWFIKEQVEEVSSMSALLKIVERAAENPLRPRSTSPVSSWATRARTRRRLPPPAAPSSRPAGAPRRGRGCA